MVIPHRKLSIDINRPNQYTVDFIAHVGDKNTRYIDITFNADGEPIELEQGCAATVTYVSDGVLIEQEAECDVNGSTVIVGIDTEKVKSLRSGILEIQPKIVDGSGNIIVSQIPVFVRISPDIAEHGRVDDDSLGTYAEVVREIAAARGTYANLKERLDHTGAEKFVEVTDTSDTVVDNCTDPDTVYIVRVVSGVVTTTKMRVICTPNVAGQMAQYAMTKDGYIISRKFTASKWGAWDFIPDSKRVAAMISDAIAGKADSSAIPTKTSQLTNDSGFLTSHQDISGKENTSNKKTSIGNQSREGDSDTNYPTVGAVRNFVNYVKDDLENYVEETISPKQDKLTAGENITISNNNVISAEAGGVTSYNNLTDKPQINNVELSGNKTLAALGINAGTVGFDETGTYADGSIGAGVSNQKNALNFTNQGALDYALNYDIDLFKFLKWTKGQYVDNSNGNILNDSRFYISDPIEVSDLKSDYLHLVITNSFTLKYAQYDANGDFLRGSSYGSAVDCVLNIQDTCKTIRFSVGAWRGTYTLSDYLNAITIYVKPAHNVVIEDYIGCEELDFLYDKYIVTPSVSTANVSTTPVSFDKCVCLSTPCTKGQIFTITGTPRDNTGGRPVMFLDQANTCIYRSAETSAFNNVEITAPVTGTLVVNFLKAYPFQCYTGFKNLSEKIFKNLDSVNAIKSFPVDIIPDWLTNAMAIRTVGPLQKGYICLTCDDGATELESYTIPMLLNKQVPCTFGLWASTSKIGAAHPFNKSPVLQTPSGIAAVKNAITAGCSVAQHGPHEWTDMTNEFLNEFFDREAAAWEALEIDVKGAICPSHCINNAVRVTAGGRFGVVRSGYRGYLSKADQQAVINGDVFAEYNYYCAGPRSNVFGLSSFNTNAVTLSWMKSAVDYAIAQKMILVVYWHDWDLTAEQKSDLEAFIDYAKAQNITFCTLGEIPFLA